MPKKFICSAIILVVILGAGLVLLRGSEDTWICQNGEWVKHGNPASSMPKESCGKSSRKGTMIRVTKPQPEEIVASPLVIEGEARGGWFFEVEFPVQLLGKDDYEVLAQGIARAQGEWMTSEFVPFKAILEFAPTTSQKGTLILEKSNPSGLPENADQVMIPVRFQPEETITVKVFFNNDAMDPEFSCNKVFPVQREIAKTQSIARDALGLLLAGPTEKEKVEGYFTNINPGVEIQNLTVKQGVARVDFDEQLEFQVGGSCRVAAIRAQLVETLKQFSTVQQVVISINGRTEDILQP